MSELAELQTQILELQKKTNQITIQEKAATLENIKVKIKTYGITMKELNELVTGNVRAHLPVAVKYRHPDNKDLAWTGRGRQPKWMVEYLEAGGTLGELSV